MMDKEPSVIWLCRRIRQAAMAVLSAAAAARRRRRNTVDKSRQQRAMVAADPPIARRQAHLCAKHRQAVAHVARRVRANACPSPLSRR